LFSFISFSHPLLISSNGPPVIHQVHKSCELTSISGTMVPPKPTPFVSTFHKTYLAAEDCDLTHPALATKPVQVSAASDFADLQA
jgi:hypothetical protein